jgi:type II secretory pathway pseudopilin PulG
MSSSRTPATRPFFARPVVLEALVGLSILLALAGIVMPEIRDGVHGSRRSGAQDQMQVIAQGLVGYVRDTSLPPTGVDGRTNIHWLYGPGRIPASQPFGTPHQARALEDALLNRSMGRERWRGPYVDAALQPDPWGRAYLVNADGWITPGEEPMVVSAGPDGIVQTAPWARRAGGDDLLLVMD